MPLPTVAAPAGRPDLRLDLAADPARARMPAALRLSLAWPLGAATYPATLAKQAVVVVNPLGRQADLS